MNIEYNYEYNSQNITYILCTLVFVSVFFISVKLISISILFSLLLYLILTIATGLYLINIERYSVYKYDILTFNAVFFVFSVVFLVNLTLSVWNANLEHNIISIMFIVLFLSISNHIISVIKICHSNILSKYKSILIFICYSYMLFVSIILFSNIYIIQSNLSVKNYLSENFTYDQTNKFYTEVIKSSEPENLLSYNLKPNFNIVYNTFSESQLKDYIFLRFKPVNRVEDYIFFSVKNSLNESNNEVICKGTKLKYIVILQKYLFITITFFTVICLIESNKVIQIYKK